MSRCCRSVAFAIVLAAVLLGSGPVRAGCPTCFTAFIIPPGHGPASASDSRRIVTIQIDSSWDSSPGQTTDRIWNAAVCAVDKWNNARDQYGNSTGYYFKIDQQGQYGSVADVTVKKAEDCSNGAWGCHPGLENVQSEIHLSGRNATATTLSNDDVCGRIAHELEHKLGGSNGVNCSDPTVMWGTISFATGARVYNDVSGSDVAMVNRASANPSGCEDQFPTGDPEPEVAVYDPCGSCIPAYYGCYYWDYECQCCTTLSPIAISVKGRLSFSSAASGVLYDILGVGSAMQVGWPDSPYVGWLALDRNGNGRIDDGTELFGNATQLIDGARAKNGFEALHELDTNHDGQLDARDSLFTRLVLWFDRMRDGVSTDDELVPVNDEIKSISLDYRESRHRDRWGNGFRYRALVRLADGSNTFAYDVFPSMYPDARAKGTGGPLSCGQTDGKPPVASAVR